MQRRTIALTSSLELVLLFISSTALAQYQLTKQILTFQGSINVTLDIAGDGGTQSQVGDRPASPVTNISLEPNHFYGQVRAEPGLPDSPTRPFIIELELSLHGDKLIGAATFGLLPEDGGDGDQLPHLMSLARANQ